LRKLKYAFSQRMNTVLCHVLRLYSWTFRVTVENEDAWMAYLKGGGKVLLCAWHQQFFAAIRHFKSYESFKPSLMISKSQDGEIIARIAAKQGWHAVRGSSSRDGGKALKEMIDRLRQSRLAGHIVDGPKGPAGIVKAGVISMARATDAVVVPFHTTADRAWYFRSWDRFMLPKPFARVTICFGQMMHFPAQDDRQTFESQRSRLEEIMRPELLTVSK
jgi:lysophospholipid acyltransferase (LPLAT)-like uncharacterized protein